MALRVPVPGDILWLGAGQTIDDVEEGQLNHPVAVAGGVEQGQVVICGITSFGGTPLEDRFQDPNMRFKYLPLYFDPPNPDIDNSPERGLKVVITHGSPFSRRSYVEASKPFRVPTTALSPLARGRAKLDPDALTQLRREILIRNPTWEGRLGPVETSRRRTSARRQGPVVAPASLASRRRRRLPADPPSTSASYAFRSNLATPTTPLLGSASRASHPNLTSRIDPSSATASHASRSNFAPSIAPSVPAFNFPHVEIPAPQSSRTYSSTATRTPQPASASTFSTHERADEGRARVVGYRPIIQLPPRSSCNHPYALDLENGPVLEEEEERGWNLERVAITIAVLGVGIYSTMRYLMGRD
ncbi:hypothetical protein BDZ91DRAFT_742240 [Kalaharituber pfeilii]|nr:hypothetical protein BDZ91DRAFT_742240 [Kalaharituber pfeilii]